METTTTIKEKKLNTPNLLQADYALLSAFFIYPHNNAYIEKIKEAHDYLSLRIPEAAEAMNVYMEFISKSSLTEVQELFLRSFDVQAITTLDIGFILFGEDYKRGQLLVHLNREHREAGNVCETELSDHLPNVLRLLAKMKDMQIRDELALRLVIPAVEKMIGEFDDKKIEKKDEVYKKHFKTVIEYSPVYRSVYQSLLQALMIALKNDFGYEPMAEPDQETKTYKSEIIEAACGSCAHNNAPKDFGGNVENELNIEQ
ncbi:MAG: hypothetical protein JST47_15245 [Bacteroidetes bacterium]|nr:hypothetical protein [Bacteroidota bacterium]MBS1974907.1 hypothetical protein [Bacteroidota bacterium]